MPALPQSIGAPGACAPRMPTPRTRSSSGPSLDHLGADRARDGDRRLGVAGAPEAADAALAVGERAEQDGALRDALHAGNGDGAANGRGRLDPADARHLVGRLGCRRGRSRPRQLARVRERLAELVAPATVGIERDRARIRRGRDHRARRDPRLVPRLAHVVAEQQDDLQPGEQLDELAQGGPALFLVAFAHSLAGRRTTGSRSR